MCLGVYGRVLGVTGELAVVDFGGGLTKEVLVGVEDVKGGDYVVVHAGVIVSRLSEKDFAQVFSILEEAARRIGENNQEAMKYLERIRVRLKEKTEATHLAGGDVDRP
ncbi:MAG: HypC/HybG/HupF family hydrogenase formation chaperone [Nitrososphaerota archaeon]